MISNTKKLLNISIGPIDGILTGTTSPGQSRPGSNDNEKVFQGSWTIASPSDFFVSYQGHSIRRGLILS